MLPQIFINKLGRLKHSSNPSYIYPILTINVVFDIDTLIFEAISIYLLDTNILTFMNMPFRLKKLNFEVFLANTKL